MTSPATAPPATEAARPGTAEGRDDRPGRSRRGTGEGRLRRHLLGRRPTDQLWGWLGPLLVTAIGGVLRFWHLDRPHQLVFDETYYVKQAYTLWQNGYENQWPKEADARFTVGQPDIYLQAGDRAVHPPVGKWMIAVGEWLFGIDSSWGWRFSAAVVGTLMILILARTARRLLGSTLLGSTAGLLLAVDGHHLVHSRTSLLDIFLAFWVLCAFAALVVDRDRSRARLAAAVARARNTGTLTPWGPWLGARPWRLVAALCLGLACGVKWSALFYLAAFGVMTVVWDMSARRGADIERWFTAGVLKDGVPAALTMLPIALVVYVSSWAGWFASEDGYLRRWASENPSGSAVPDALRSLWHYHADMLSFHEGLSAEHPYQSGPWSWLVQGRPTSFFYEDPSSGQMGCAVETCSRAITSLGNPLIWWGATLSLAVVAVVWVARRDWRAGAILAGVGAGLLPWFMYPDRTIYAFYSVTFEPYVVLALAYGLGLVLGPPVATAQRRLVGAGVAGGFVVACVAASAFFWPVWTAVVIPYSQWQLRMWLPSWV